MEHLMLRFSDSLSEQWFNHVMKDWRPKTENIVFIPCASKKPYWTSVTHRSFFGRLWNLWFKGRIDLVVLSEPLTAVPADYDYPFAKYPLYDYPPKELKKNPKEQAIWRKRLDKFLRKLNSKRKYAILYEYHSEVLGSILRKHDVFTLYTQRPYIAKTVRKLLKVIRL
ncbi:MAG: DUF5591 domain-containing protein [Thermoprotei archaeon]|nr:DUF5591 domain-containing protein [Thermoprotei archaeon]